jgi:uncharacterized protein with PIN domain
MLGSLARWLRFFGHDTLFEPRMDDRELAALAEAQGRWLLTRDRDLAAVGPRTVLIRSEGLEEQLQEVFQRRGLSPEPTLDRARCGACNGELEDVSRAAVSDSVPPYVAGTASRFRRCRACGRVYWPGSHGERILARMRRVCEAVALHSAGHRALS